MKNIVVTIILSLMAQTGVIGILIRRISSKQKGEKEKNAALCKGVQAILRHYLYEQHSLYCENKKYAPAHVKEDFDNMYKQYHALGQNGVMDGIYNEFMRLPTQEGDGNE
ncbi:MAG: hypothetical protein IKI58_04135 [Oscillospiraceae bacterium]|nr:hypothetical protein [Oscillospiraceae bacterium]